MSSLLIPHVPLSYSYATFSDLGIETELEYSSRLKMSAQFLLGKEKELAIGN
jgi:hypothetical protein